MKKIALISPKGNAFGKNEKLLKFLEETNGMESFRALWTGPNLGLITIAALFPSDWEAEYIDENYKAIDYEKKYDIVCISAMTQQIVNAYQIIDKFKSHNVLTVIGGIHATVLPDEAAQHADVVVVGEGERTWPQFISDYECGNVKRVYKDDSGKRFLFENHVMPRYDLLKGYNYPIITLQTTRGCPHDCSFCCASKVFGSGYRRKSNADILQELDLIKKMFPDALILFADDNFLVHRKECKNLLKEMIELDIRWLAQTDVSISQDDELLELMVLSGCQWVVIGFESVHFDSLYQLDNKNWKLKQLPGYEQTIGKIQSFGIGVYGTFIVGLDEDDINVFEETENFIKQNKLYGVNVTVPTPLPGTRLRDTLKEEDRILVDDWSCYTFWDVTIQPMKMSINELEEGLLKIYKNIFDDSQVYQRLTHMKQLAKNRNQIMKNGKRREGVL
jgi:radical SAM superfamily enzyme YgiQ (UPF0313 family)